MKSQRLKTFAAVSAASFLLAPFLVAQDAPPAPAASVASAATPDATAAAASASPNASPALDRMEQFRQRMNERLKTELKASDEEWTVIQPLLEKVQNKIRDASPFLRGFGRGGRPRNAGANAEGSPGQAAASPDPRPMHGGDSPEMSALRAALESDSSAPADIQTKLAALRESRKKATADLEAARQDLVKVLTQRQEATLVLIGILD